MPLTPEQVQALEKKQLANIAAKVVAGKSLNRHEQAIFDRSKQSLEPYLVNTWGEVAQHLGCSRRHLTNVRKKYALDPELPKDREDGRKDANDWRRFFALRNLWSGADSTVDGEPTKADWDRKRAEIDYERAKFSLEIEKRKHVELDEILAAVGQMLAGFRTTINMLPGSAARWLIGLKDFHAIKSKLQSEVDAVLTSLGRCKYLEGFEPCEKCLRHFIEAGRESLSDLTHRDFTEQ